MILPSRARVFSRESCLVPLITTFLFLGEATHLATALHVDLEARMAVQHPRAMANAFYNTISSSDDGSGPNLGTLLMHFVIHHFRTEFDAADAAWSIHDALQRLMLLKVLKENAIFALTDDVTSFPFDEPHPHPLAVLGKNSLDIWHITTRRNLD